MYETLSLPARDEDCLLLEMCATLELHEHAKFPSGSELTGFVEVAITQPGLQNHRWKCVTRLTRPAELLSDDNKPNVYTNDSGIHRRGCSDAKKDCDCHARARPDIHVPFPAVEWASILSMAVQYPDLEHQRLREKRRRNAEAEKKEVERAGSKRKRSEDEGDAASWARREPTGSDLICKVAMYQELWSCAPDSTQWTRQAIIFWRFNTTNQWQKYNPVFKPAGTTWRWLTINDPMSRYHQQKALVYPPAGVSRDSIMSPTPTIGQHLTAAMNETFSSAWENESNVSQPVPPLQTSGSSGLSLFDSFSNGLATPPPTATLPGPYSGGGSFDSNLGAGGGINFVPSTGPSRGPQGDRQPGSSMAGAGQTYFDGQAAFPDMKPMTSGVSSYSMQGAGTAVTTSLEMPNQLCYDNSACEAGAMQGWDMSALDNWAGQAGPGATSATEWGATAVKVESSGDHHHAAAAAMWAPPPWPLPAGVAPGSHERGGSPRPLKRRRGAIDGGVPVTAGW